jgi:hypothetical protein
VEDLPQSPTFSHFAATIDKRFKRVKEKLLDFAFWTMTYLEYARIAERRWSKLQKNKEIRATVNVNSRSEMPQSVAGRRQQLRQLTAKLAYKPGSVQGIPLVQSSL